MSIQPGGAAGNEEAYHHDDSANDVGLIARHVDARECHVGRADLERDDEVAEGREREWHDAQEYHDRAMHGAEGIASRGADHAAGSDVAEHPFEDAAHDGKRFAGYAMDQRIIIIRKKPNCRNSSAVTPCWMPMTLWSVEKTSLVPEAQLAVVGIVGARMRESVGDCLRAH